ncbi:MAG: RNA polymerase sigma factor [Bacteroidia bacterium]|nr:RNA polymerase sigma factor [Bacteroidia bacterium]
MELEEFRAKVIPTSDKLCRFALRLLKNKQEAEDVVQDVLVKLWNRRKDIGTYKNPEAFAMTVTKNMCLDILRTRKRFVDNEPRDEPDRKTPLDVAEWNDVRSQIDNAMNTLPEQQKMIVQLRDIEGYDYEEIAQILEINVNTIRVNLSRARAKIREILTNTYSYGLE